MHDKTQADVKTILNQIMRTIAVNLTVLHHNKHVIRGFITLICYISLLAMPTSGANDAPKSVSDHLTQNALYQAGSKAMADHLYGVAVSKFRLALQTADIPSEAIPYLQLALVESLIRAGTEPQGDNQFATEALQLLSEETISAQLSAPIWRAEALALLGRYQEADDALAEIPKTHTKHSQIQLTRARILLALGQTTDALEILIKTGQSSSPEIRNAANLLACEIHIKLGNHENASATLDKIDGQMAAAAKIKEYLEARLALSEKKSAQAINRFQSLITAPDNLPEQIFHACILGKADAQAANQQTDDAISTLEQFIDNYPNSSILHSAFDRLSAILPDKLNDDSSIMSKLRQWSGDTPPPSNGLYIQGENISAMLPYQPQPSTNDDLVSLALYHRATLLARSEEAGNNELAMALLARLRAQHVTSPLLPSELYLKLSSASLIDTAYLHLKQNDTNQATFTLSVMEKVAFSPRLRDEASFLRGLLLAEQNEPIEALSAFDYARQSSSQDISEASSINAAMMALKGSNLSAFDEISTAAQNNFIRTSLHLERALWKCGQNDPTGPTDLESFIVNNPGHPRENEARLSLAAAAVMISPMDVDLARAQIEIISPRLADAENQYKITKILIRAEELAQHWEAAAAAAERFIANFSDDPNIPYLQLKLGESYFHNEDYNKARRILQDIPENHPESPYSPYASFQAAMSARLGGTIQAREECLSMFQKIIDSDHPHLSQEARIQQARVLIDLRRYQEAEKTLAPLLASKDIPTSLLRSAGVLMADCLHRQGPADTTKYDQAITIYNQLLSEQDLPLAWRNRLHFLRGQTYESMSLWADAFGSYYDVIIESHQPASNAAHDEEWLWFYRCGFKALSMLEREQRWTASVKLARRIASFDGPRAEEATKRANSLAKKHMIWEDSQPLSAEPASNSE